MVLVKISANIAANIQWQNIGKELLATKLRFTGRIFQQLLFAFIVSALLALIYSIWHAASDADSFPISLQDENISQQYSYLVSENSDASVESIVNQEFTGVVNRAIPYALDTKDYWIRISVTNNQQQAAELVLHGDNALLAIFDVYDISQSNTINQVYAFDQKNIINKNSSKLIFPHLELVLSANQTKELLIKIKTFGPPNVPIVLYQKDSFAQYLQLSQLLFGAFIGIMLMFATYNIVLYKALKDKIYLIYLGYLISAFIVLASINGFGYYLFPVNILQFINHHTLFFHYLSAIFLVLFTVYFLRYETSHLKLYKSVLILAVALFITAIIAIQLDHISQAKIFLSIQPLLYVLAITLIAIKFKKTFSWARYYFISWLPLLVGVAMQPLLLLNKVEYSFLTKSAFLIAVLIEISFMAFALAERVRRNEQDRLQELYYHVDTLLPKQLLLQRSIEKQITNARANFSLMLIKPEQIEQINLYINDTQRTMLYRKLAKQLSALFTHNSAIIALTDKHEKIALLDNFSLAIVVDNNKTTQSHQILISSIQKVVSSSFQLEQLVLPLSAYISMANYPEHASTSNALINCATLAHSQALNSIKMWASYEQDGSVKQQHHLNLAADLKAAIQTNALELYHQPQIDLKTLRVCGSECLLRWQHKTEGLIPPAVFIDIAQDTGLINELTLWTLNTALIQHQDIIDNGNTNHMLSINISGKDVSSAIFYQQVVDILAATEISPDKIIFEITESATITDNEQALISINLFNELGITMSIDDFGSSHSSLAHINNLPFNELKIDRQFVENACQSRKTKVIVQTMAKMGKSLGLEVVAEGINSLADEQAMKAFGCDIGQGYYYAEAMPIMDYLVWLNDQVNGHVSAQQGEFIAAKADK